MSLPRSYLFVPGDRPERYAKACAAGADAVIVDLEDAVAPEAKDAARAALVAWLSPAQPVLVRINAAGTPWFDADIAICSLPGVAGVVLPKAADEREIESLALHLPGVAILPLIESAAGLWNVEAVAHASQVQRLLFGSIDFQLDTGIEGEGEELLYARSRLVLASRACGLPAPVDGVSTATTDAEAVAADTRRARRLGFGAKLCIHPAQVAAVHAAFAPSADEIARARRIVAAADAAGGAAVALDGRMIDLPIILKAREILGRIAHDNERTTP